MKTVFLIFLLIILYLLIGVLTTLGTTHNNPIHKFTFWTDWYESGVNIKTADDKFSLFILIVFWLPLVIFYYLPIGLYRIGKFLVEFIGWCIAKLFKL